MRAWSIAGHRDLVRLQHQPGTRSPARCRIHELVGGVWEDELGDALGQCGEERAGTRVRDDRGAMGQDARLRHIALDADVVGLRTELRGIPGRPDGHEDPDATVRDRLQRDAQGRAIADDGAEGDVHQRIGAGSMSVSSPEGSSSASSKAIGRSGWRLGTWLMSSTSKLGG